MSRQVSVGSAGNYQADEQAGVARLSWRVSGRRAVRGRPDQLGIIRQMSRQVARDSAGEYQVMSRQVSQASAGDYEAEEQAGVARLSWRLSSR